MAAVLARLYNRWGRMIPFRLLGRSHAQSQSSSARDPTLTITGAGGWLWRYIQPSDIKDVQELCLRAVGKVDYVPSHLAQYLKDHRTYALGAEADGQIAHVSFLVSQDDGKTLYHFGGRTHPEFQGRGHVKSSWFHAVKNLVIDPYERNVTKLRSRASPDSTAAVNAIIHNGFKQIHCYESSSFQHNDPDKGAGKISYLIQSTMASCNIKSIHSRSDSVLVRPTKVSGEFEIIDSHLVPAGVFVNPDCVCTATKDNVEMLQKMGHKFFISSHEQSENWRPEVFSYGGIASLPVCPTWACTINSSADPDDCTLLHVLTHAQLAVDCAMESKGKEPVAQLVCLFDSVSLKEQADALLTDWIGFEQCTSLQGTGPAAPYAIFEREVL